MKKLQFIIILFFLSCAGVLCQDAQWEEDALYKSTYISNNVDTISFSGFVGKRIKDLLDSLGRNYIYFDLDDIYVSRSAIVVYPVNDSLDLNISMELGFDTIYVWQSINSPIPMDLRELEKERIKNISSRLTKFTRNVNINHTEYQVIRKRQIESSLLENTKALILYEYSHGKKLTEQNYINVNYCNMLNIFKDKSVKEILDSIGWNFHGYRFNAPDDSIKEVNLRYYYMNEYEIEVALIFKEKFIKRDYPLKDILNKKIKKIFNYLLPLSKRTDFIKNEMYKE